MNEQELNEVAADIPAVQGTQTEAIPEEQVSSPQEGEAVEPAAREVAPPQPEEGADEKSDGPASPLPEEEVNSVASPATALEERIDALTSKSDALAERIDAVREGAVALQKAVTGFYTQTTDSMHHELEKFRKGLVRKLEQELFGELMELYDAADKAAALVAEDSSRALPLLEGIRDQIDAALFNRGVEKREATTGEKFDARRHHVVRPDVPTGDASLDGAVAATAKPGFDDMDDSFKDLRGGCMKLRPVHVRLYKFDPALAPHTPDSGTDTCEPGAVVETPDAAARPNDHASETMP